MKKLLLTIIAILCITPTFANDSNSELEEYLPVAEKLYSGKTVEALQMAEELSPRNHFASILLYLVYSRGYCGQSIDYQKAAQYFDRLLAVYNDSFPGGRFHYEEFSGVWRKMLVPPVGSQRSVTLKSWNQHGRVINQKINLKGKQPLKNCYFEKTRIMGNIAGASIWAAAPRTFPDRTKFGVRLQKEAIKYGSIDALYGIIFPDFRTRNYEVMLMGSNYDNICKAAESGHIPAKILLASIFIEPDNKYKYAPDEAYQLLKSVIQELETYKDSPCKHYLRDLDNAKFLLSLLPDPKQSTEKLAAMHNVGDDQRKAAAYQKLLASRNDHPVCEIFKIFQLPLKDREKAFMLAAERGNPEIIALLLRWKNAQPEYWKLLYLAGKYGLAAKYNPQPSQSFYSQSLAALNQARIMMKAEEYRQALNQLGNVYPEARTQYILYFGSPEDNSAERFRFEVSNPEAVKITRENTPVGNFYVLEIQQDTQQNYVDIFIKPGRFNFSIRPYYANGKSFPFPKASDIWTVVQYPDGKAQQFYGTGFEIRGKCPERIRINIGPGKQKSFMKITL